MFVVLVGLRFGVAPFLWRSEDRAPADEAVLESVDCARGQCSGGRSSTSVTSRSGDAFTFRRKTAEVILPALNVGSFTAAD